MFIIWNVNTNGLWLEISNLTVMDSKNSCKQQTSYDNLKNCSIVNT